MSQSAEGSVAATSPIVATSPMAAISPVIAIIVPLFAHSVVVVDALESAIGQVCRYPIVIVVVNDGCRFAESDLQIKSILAMRGDMVRYVVQKNAGLSAARNTGIEYALREFTTVQAVYFLDADNALQPRAMDNAYSELLRHPDASWVYPNIDMFGIRRNFDYGGPYSPLKHLRYNVCEAGSLVHRRVFDAGVRFDETMKLGYEDWDFWLNALQHGMRGVHHPHFGFRYRNRAESMLRQSKRDDAQISAYMQRKHQSLLDRGNLLRLEQAEAPRFAILLSDTKETLLTSGPLPGARSLPQDAFDRLFWRNIIIPAWQHIPPIFIFTTRSAYDELSRAGLLLWVLHDCERALDKMNFACVTFEPADGFTYGTRAGGTTRDCSLLAAGLDALIPVIKDEDTGWIERIQNPGPEMKVSNRTVMLPQPAQPGLAPGSIVFEFLLRIIAWRSSAYRWASRKNWLWRDASVPPPHALHLEVREAYAREVVYPAVEQTGRHIGFVISIGSFGGVERVAYNVAREFAAGGWQVHLFLLGGNSLKLPEEFAGFPTSINFIEDAVFNAWDAASEYHGTALPAVAGGPPQSVHRLVAALGWLDAVVNCHSGALNAAAAALRKMGVKTLTHLHLIDQTPLRKSVGHTMIALAYEHAYDLVVCNSARLESWMHAAGIPQDKLLHVPNAPGYSIDAVVQARLLARPREVGHLNALYIGRLDRQKGMDRLAQVVERTRRLGVPVDWRIVGDAVTDSTTVPAILARLREPAVFDKEALSELFAWADVMVLMSDYEGVPLTVLEARRAGVVVVATNVGSLSEVVESGTTGFLVELDTAVEETVEILGILCNAPVLRRHIATAAANVSDWRDVTGELIARVTALVDDRQCPERSVVPPLPSAQPVAANRP